MTTLNDVLAQTVADLQAAIPAATIAAHPGKFDLRELDKYGAKKAEIRVALTAISPTTPPQRRALLPVQVAAYIVCRADAQMRDPAERNRLIASQLLGVVRTHAVGSSVASTPRDIGWTNLYAGAVGERGVSLSAVQWIVDADLTPAFDAGAAADFLRLYADYDVPGEESPHPQDQIQMPQ